MLRETIPNAETSDQKSPLLVGFLRHDNSSSCSNFFFFFTQDLALARSFLYWLFLRWGLALFPGSAWITSYRASPCRWDDRHMPPHPAQWPWTIILLICPSTTVSRDYSLEPPCPVVGLEGFSQTFCAVQPQTVILLFGLLAQLGWQVCTTTSSHCWDGGLWTFACPWTTTLPISTSWVATHFLTFLEWPLHVIRSINSSNPPSSVESGLKPMRTGHKQGEMQLIAFTCRSR
jgi:hypothetical protein